jgi:condensin complex subunit 3
MAKNSFRLFLSQSEAKKLPEHIKLKVLQAVFDILMVHERDFLDKTQEIVRS